MQAPRLFLHPGVLPPSVRCAPVHHATAYASCPGLPFVTYSPSPQVANFFFGFRPVVSLFSCLSHSFFFLVCPYKSFLSEYPQLLTALRFQFKAFCFDF